MEATFQTLTIFIGGTQENKWQTFGLSDAHARVLEDIRWEKNKRYGLKKEGLQNFLNSIDPFVRYYVIFMQYVDQEEGSVAEYEVVQISIPQEPRKTFKFNNTPKNIRSLLRTLSPTAQVYIEIPAVSSSNSEFNVYGSQREEDMKRKYEEDQLEKQKQELEKQLLEVKQKLAQYK